MAVTVDSQAFQFAFPPSATWAHTCSGANLLLLVHVGVTGLSSSTAITGVTYNAVAMNLLYANNNIGSNGLQDQVYYLIGPTAGTHNVVVSATGGNSFLASSVSFNDVHQTVPLGTLVLNAVFNSSISDNIPLTAGDLGVDFLECTTAVTITAGGSQTTVYSLSFGGMRIAMSTITGVGSTAMGWSASGVDVLVHDVIPVLHTASGGGGGTGSAPALLAVGLGA